MPLLYSLELTAPLLTLGLAVLLGVVAYRVRSDAAARDGQRLPASPRLNNRPWPDNPSRRGAPSGRDNQPRHHRLLQPDRTARRDQTAWRGQTARRDQTAWRDRTARSDQTTRRDQTAWEDLFPPNPAGWRAGEAPGTEDFGLLRPVATVNDLDTAESVRALLAGSGVRATVATGPDGRVRVLVFRHQYDRAYRLISWVL